MMKSYEEFQTFGKDGFEACMAAGTAWSKGLQTLAQEAADYSRRSFEKSSEVFEKAAAAKSFDKVVELQQTYAKEAYEGFVAQMNKVNEIVTTASKEAFKPFEASFASFGIKPVGK